MISGPMRSSIGSRIRRSRIKSSSHLSRRCDLLRCASSSPPWAASKASSFGAAHQLHRHQNGMGQIYPSLSYWFVQHNIRTSPCRSDHSTISLTFHVSHAPLPDGAHRPQPSPPPWLIGISLASRCRSRCAYSCGIMPWASVTPSSMAACAGQSACHKFPRQCDHISLASLKDILRLAAVR